MPAADFAQLYVTWRSANQWTYHKNQQIVNVGLLNPTQYEIASIDADLIITDRQGNEIDKKPLVFKKFTDNYSGFKGSMLPQSAAYGGTQVKMETPEFYRVQIKSATYFPKGDDLSDRGHLFAAVARGDNDAVEKQIEKDSGLRTAKDPETGLTLLHEAAASNNMEITTYLVDKGADYDLPAKNSWTPLFCAFNGGASEVASYLLDHGANTETKKNAVTALELASARCSGEVIEKLIAAGSNPNEQTGKRANPLESAASSGNESGAKALIAHGAAVNYQDPSHMAPIFHAVYSGQAGMVRFLIESGAQVDITNKAGYTPLMIAAGRSSADVVQLLIDKGAFVPAKGPDGKTPLEYAQESGNEDAAEVLRAAMAKSK